MLTGLWAPLGRLIAAIPKPIASAMLAGILLKLCLAPFMAIGKAPWLAGAVLATWLVVRPLRARLCGAGRRRRSRSSRWHSIGRSPAWRSRDLVPRLEFVTPVFTWEAMVNIALPLFIVTMAGQNLPGLAVLAAYDYRPRIAPVLLSTGAASALGALFGMPTINLAAITAALCAGPDAHADPARRYIAGIFGGDRLRVARGTRRRRGGAGRALAAGADRGGRRPRADRRVRQSRC